MRIVRKPNYFSASLGRARVETKPGYFYFSLSGWFIFYIKNTNIVDFSMLESMKGLWLTDTILINFVTFR